MENQNFWEYLGVPMWFVEGVVYILALIAIYLIYYGFRYVLNSPVGPKKPVLQNHPLPVNPLSRHRKMKKSKLEGYGNPVEIDMTGFYKALNAAGMFNRLYLDGVCTEIKSYLKLGNVRKLPTTEDGYTWFCDVYFKSTNGTVVVLLPWFQDWKKSDGSQADRIPAIYTQGDVTTEEVSDILKEFGDTLQKWNEKG